MQIGGAISRYITSSLIVGYFSRKTPRATQGVTRHYRNDIDGLRAICVCAVIFYHISPSRFPAGGIGVDLFFVISGFLIGGIVISEVKSDRFSFSEFYIRRLRRIAPAFLAMAIVTSLAGGIFLYPWEFVDLAWSSLFSLACLSNIYFYFTAGYFAPSSNTLPMLHTWSLGVEEQFYIFFPFIPIIFKRYQNKHFLVFALALSTVISFIVSCIQVQTSPTAAFYLLPSRWWEIMIGVGASQVPVDWVRRQSVSTICAIISACLIAYSLVFVRPEAGFPGSVVFPACLGAGLYLASGKHGPTFFHMIMSISPLRYIGLASYSLYIWHWPIIVYLRLHLLVGKFSLASALYVLIAIFVAGFGSWHYVERPFRKGMTRQKLIRLSILFLAVAVLIQAVIIAFHGMPQRIPDAALKIARAGNGAGSFPASRAKCFLPNSAKEKEYDAARCLSHSIAKKNWLLIGDSHAAMMWDSFSQSIPQVNWQAAGVYGCEISLNPAKTGRLCDDLIYSAIFERPADDRLDAVVVMWRWPNIDLSGLAALRSRLASKGIKLIVIGPTPEYSISVPRILAEGIRRRDPNIASKAMEPWLWRNDAILSANQRNLGFTYLSPLSAMCPRTSQCILTARDGYPLYFDSGHYNKMGAAMAARKIIENDSQVGYPLRNALR